MNVTETKRKLMAIVIVLALLLMSGCNARGSEKNENTGTEPTPLSSPAYETEKTPEPSPGNSTEPTESDDPSQAPESQQPEAIVSESPQQTGTPDTSQTPETQEPAISPSPSTEPSETPEPNEENDDTFYSMNLFPVRPETSIIQGTRPKIEITSTSYRLEFLNPVELYASTGPGRPSSLPGAVQIITMPPIVDLNPVFTEDPPEYSNGFREAFVEKDSDEVLWFAWKSDNKNIASLEWQISDRPFVVTGEEAENPPGLLDSGTLASNEREFTIDFSSLGKFSLGFTFNMPSIVPINPIMPILIPLVDEERVNPEQRIYYVRIIARDSSGRIIGEPDKGIEVLYGDRKDFVSNSPLMKFPFELLFGSHNGPGGPQNEFYNTFLDTYERTYEPSASGLLYFRPEEFPTETDTILIQVCTSQPSNKTGSWRDPAGLIYEKWLEKGDEDFDNLTDPDHGIGIDVKAFATNPPSVYYVRAVALSDGPTAGTVKDAYSRVVKLNYGPLESQFEYIPPPEVIYLDPGLPDLEFIEYSHPNFEDPEWMYYYEVLHQPTYSEYYALMPSMFVNNADELVEGLTPGTVIYIKPKEESDDGWWDKVKDAISNAFGSIKDFVADLTNWVSDAYSDLKADMIEFVANNLPLVPEEFRDELKQAMEYMVDYGLASMGIPPELPNFDQLTNMGADYIAATALEQAGIPADEWTVDMVKDLASGISENTNSAAASGTSPNPFGWNFVRQNPGTMYSPAHILIELTNNTDNVTPKGTLSGKVFTNIQSSELSDPNKMWLSSAFGGTLYFELYRPVHGLSIPQLQPGQSMQIPIYLEKYTGMAYPFAPHVVTDNDFNRLYSHLGDYTFAFSIDYELPPVDDYAADLGLEPKGRYHVYEYTQSMDGFSFIHDPSEDLN